MAELFASAQSASNSETSMAVIADVPNMQKKEYELSKKRKFSAVASENDVEVVELLESQEKSVSRKAQKTISEEDSENDTDSFRPIFIGKLQ